VVPAPPPVDRRARAALLGIVALGAALRLWTVGDGAPYVPGVDEPAILDIVVRMMRTGDFHPHFFDYPGVTFYLHVLVGSLRFLAGAMAREWASLDQVWSGALLVWARTATALLSVVTIYLVYRIGRRWSVFVALVAALAMAVHPQLVQNAQYALTDTPLTFFVALALLTALVAAEDGRPRWFLVAGVTVGLAAATKYNGALVGIAPLAAALTSPAVTTRGGAIAAVVAGAAAGLFAGAPYTLLDLPGFLNGFAALAQHYNQDRPAIETADLYRKYMQDWFAWPGTLPRMVAWPATGLVIAGLLRAVWELRLPGRRAPALVLLLFPAAYYWMIANQSLVYARYAMPLAPAMSIALALGIVALGGWLARRTERAPWRRLAAAAPLLVLLPPLLTATFFNLDRRKVSTTEQAADWLMANVPQGSTVVMESPVIRLPPSRMRFETVAWLINEPLSGYRDRGVSHLIANSMQYDRYFNDPGRYARQITAYSEIFRGAEPVQTFAPSADHPGPTIRILKVVR
jgi:4-amino-4-deoxy-L-arabinose transferase-like glycosyltransferase